MSNPAEFAEGSAASVYERGELASLDIGAQMREGHVDVRTGDEYIVSLVSRLLDDRPAGSTIVDIGSGSGVLSELLARKLPQHRVIANDTAASNFERARRRLAPYANASVFERPFESMTEAADVFVSWGTHHHLAHGYLSHIRKLLKPGGRFIVGDEFCPEYLTKEELASGRAWIVGGYLFTSEEEERIYRESGALPASVRKREESRRQALWAWYRFVIDEAVKKQDWQVAMVELQIARDDFATDFADEHKTSPLLLETELKNADFEIISRQNMGDRPAQLQSFVIYETAPRGNWA